MAASMGGLDALVFTGGVGEHAAPVRATAAQRLAFLVARARPGGERGSARRRRAVGGGRFRAVVRRHGAG